MKIKVFILDTHYQGFTRSIYRKYDWLKSRSYYEQKEIIFGQEFGLSNYYSKNLKKYGIEAEEFIVNNKFLQLQWKKENSKLKTNKLLFEIPIMGDYFYGKISEEIILNQVRLFKPDVILIQNVNIINKAFFKSLKSHTKLIIAQVGYPYNSLKYDLILTPSRTFHRTFKKNGIKSKYILLAFEKTILPKLKANKKKYDISFIGSFSVAHKQGNEMLEKLLQKYKVNIWGTGLNNLPIDSLIRKYYKGEAWGLDMYNILYNSKIVINRHVDVAGNTAGNMRMFEVTGVGAMLLTDYKQNLHEFFKIGKEIESYKSANELSQKISYYLKHEPERKKIARAGQIKTLKDHTYKKRMEDLAKIFERMLKKRKK
jgi:spore maturation protein CgeB